MAAFSSSAPGQLDAAHGGGFFRFPSATYSADSAAQITPLSDPHRLDVWQTVARPVLTGDGGPSYDRTLQRWLPVPASQVSPDGTHYVYEDRISPPGLTPSTGPIMYSPRLHVVDPAAGQDRIVPSLSLPIAVGVVSYQADGIYLSAGCPEGCPPDANKLWRLDPQSGVVTKVTDLQASGGWMIANGSAWTAVNQAPSSSPPRFEITSVDLRDGSSAGWLAVIPPCSSFCRGPDVVGLDGSGRPLVELWVGDGVSLNRVMSPDQAHELGSWAAQSEGERYFAGGILEQSTTWFGTRKGLFACSPGEGLRQVSNLPLIPADSGVQP